MALIIGAAQALAYMDSGAVSRFCLNIHLNQRDVCHFPGGAFHG
ncbi:hypothetical protein [Chitinolyticbacter meiyuanensis]|nr:hypothetical protein [Chitinolyticbacter meiyuanensis]